MTNIACLLLGVCIIAVALCGCGSGGPGAQITGTVTFDGKPIPKGHLAFMPLEGVKGKSVTGEIVDGNYDVTQKVQTLGNHRVDIRAERPTGKKTPPGYPGPPIDEMLQYLPKGYNEQSQLTFEIKAGKNVANFDLKRSGP
jgi:hypothetical protein